MVPTVPNVPAVKYQEYGSLIHSETGTIGTAGRIGTGGAE
jgi:hypothetical protein